MLNSFSSFIYFYSQGHLVSNIFKLILILFESLNNYFKINFKELKLQLTFKV